MAARSPKSGRAPDDKEGQRPGSVIARAVAVAAPYVFIAGLLIAISVSLEQMLRFFQLHGSPAWSDIHNTYWADVKTIQENLGLWLGAIAAGCLTISYLLSTRVDLNEFSMHNFYRNRLVRCYLGASRQKRKPDDFIGFDPDDDILLKDLSNPVTYSGPFPIVNTSLNLVGGSELAWQERKAASFIFTPLYCGYDVHQTSMAPSPNSRVDRRLTGQPTNTLYADRGPLPRNRHGISGAAASPNSGSFTSAASSFLMTVFNARLGWWLGNPRYRGRPWQAPVPASWVCSTCSMRLPAAPMTRVGTSTSPTAGTLRTWASTSWCAAAAGTSSSATPVRTVLLLWRIWAMPFANAGSISAWRSI